MLSGSWTTGVIQGCLRGHSSGLRERGRHVVSSVQWNICLSVVVRADRLLVVKHKKRNHKITYTQILLLIQIGKSNHKKVILLYSVH